MRIGDLNLAGPFLAAPLAGVSSPAFRLMARRAGAALTYTEMVSAMALVRGQRIARELSLVLAQERPVALQLFGADPEVMHRAARMVAAMEVDLIDVNLGCPAKKIRRQGAGSALMDDPPRAAEVVAAVKEAGGGKPVTVKLRMGFRKDTLQNDLPPVLDAGAMAVCLHGRTVKQSFSGEADWKTIARLASWCPVPVIGNGDIRSGRQAADRLRESGADAVMIGRGAMGNPWIFERALARLAGKEPRVVSVAERRRTLWEHVELAHLHGGPRQALHFGRQFMMWYSKGLPDSAAYRHRAGAAKDLETLTAVTEEYFSGLIALEEAGGSLMEVAS